jgi:hypothetical protein
MAEALRTCEAAHDQRVIIERPDGNRVLVLSTSIHCMTKLAISSVR